MPVGPAFPKGPQRVLPAFRIPPLVSQAAADERKRQTQVPAAVTAPAVPEVRRGTMMMPTTRPQPPSSEQPLPTQPSSQPPSTKPEVTFIPARSFTPGHGRSIQGIILHSTDGEGQGDINTLTQTGVSVHYYVTRTGKIYQFVKTASTRS
ncbi:MAG TPA: N-acetylmuramoyl-L-alanine amidase [Terriglobales bacterium]|nr:N-acetylmuramoyl-L-alanine amidase [Terriglobales bacterium]